MQGNHQLKILECPIFKHMYCKGLGLLSSLDYGSCVHDVNVQLQDWKETNANKLHFQWHTVWHWTSVYPSRHLMETFCFYASTILQLTVNSCHESLVSLMLYAHFCLNWPIQPNVTQQVLWALPILVSQHHGEGACCHQD